MFFDLKVQNDLRSITILYFYMSIFLIYFFLQPIGIYCFKGLNIIVPLAKIVKDFGTAKEIDEKYGNMAKSKKNLNGCF